MISASSPSKDWTCDRRRRTTKSRRARRPSMSHQLAPRPCRAARSDPRAGAHHGPSPARSACRSARRKPRSFRDRGVAVASRRLHRAGRSRRGRRRSAERSFPSRSCDRSATSASCSAPVTSSRKTPFRACREPRGRGSRCGTTCIADQSARRRSLSVSTLARVMHERARARGAVGSRRGGERRRVVGHPNLALDIGSDSFAGSGHASTGFGLSGAPVSRVSWPVLASYSYSSP